ncbi:MAG: Acetyl esterase/lipase [Verrucomicrobiaceae bacterium]|nr:Acetyl esterase/lipase [Verrucomicrobiaceae bacterium]
MKFTAALAIIALCLPLSARAADPKPAPKKAPAPGWKSVKPETPAGFTLKTVLVEAHPEHNVELYVYVPNKDGMWPCILDIHGGGWKARQVEQDKPLMERLAQRGFVTALVSYRLSTEAKYPAAINDCKAALRTLRAHAKELKLDPDRIGCMGGSAGGHLSGLTAMTNGLKEFEGNGPNLEFSSTVKAAIVMAGSMDLVASNKEKTSEGAELFFGTTYQLKPELFEQASPLAHVRPGVPPTLFIEGEKDTLKIGRAEMQEKLKSLGIETGLYTLKGAPHPYWMSHPWMDETVDIADTFFKKHLGEATTK